MGADEACWGMLRVATTFGGERSRKGRPALAGGSYVTGERIEDGDVDDETAGGTGFGMPLGSAVGIAGLLVLLRGESSEVGKTSGMVSWCSRCGESASDMRRGSIISSSDVVEVEALEGAVSLGDVRDGSATRSAGRTI